MKNDHNQQWLEMAIRINAVAETGQLPELVAEVSGDFAQLSPDNSDLVTTLIIGLTHKVSGVRRACVKGLGKINRYEETVVPALARLLSDRERNVRSQAALSLGEFGARAKEALPALRKAAPTCIAAKMALGAIEAAIAAK